MLMASAASAFFSEPSYESLHHQKRKKLHGLVILTLQDYCNRKLVVGASYDCNENDKIDGIDI